MLAALDQERESQAEHTAKKQRVADGMSRRVEDADELLALSQAHGATRARPMGREGKKGESPDHSGNHKGDGGQPEVGGEPPQPYSEGDTDGLL